MNDTISNNWGGARKGAGRPPTGRKRSFLSITDEEKALLREYLTAIRKGEQWISHEQLLQEYDKRMKTAVDTQKDSKVTSIGKEPPFYKLLTVGELLGYSYAHVWEEYKGLAEERKRAAEEKSNEKKRLSHSSEGLPESHTSE